MTRLTVWIQNIAKAAIPYIIRYHIVRVAKYRYTILNREIEVRVRDIVGQVAEEMGIYIDGVVSSGRVHVLVSIPSHITASDFVQRSKGRSSRKIQMKFKTDSSQSILGKTLLDKGIF